MACERIRLRDGSVVIICSRGVREPKPKPCGICGREATRLCDYPSERGTGTCDAPLCDDCTTPMLRWAGQKASQHDHYDLCPKHSASSAQLGLFEDP